MVKIRSPLLVLEHPRYVPRSPITLQIKKFPVIDDIYIKTSDRIAIFGRSGAGKSEMVYRYLIPNYDFYTFHDIKHENDHIPHNIIIENPKDFADAINKYDKILYQPKDISITDFDAICKIIFQHKNHCLIVDEATRISSPSSISYWLNTILTQGRSFNVGAVIASQRPNSIHNTVISEANHLFIFSLNLDTDIDKLREIIGNIADEIKLLPEFHFIYFNINLHKAIIFEPVSSADEGELKVWKPTLEEYIRLVRSRYG